jgi:hypothetical protein
MDELFTKKVRAAAIAGWWTLLIAFCLLMVQYLMYLLIVPREPGWLIYLWGEDLTWSAIRTIWFWGMAVIKLGLLLMTFIVIWLTIWARKLGQVK